MSSAPLRPNHWSKDFVEHLRTVHFTLIALCLGLIILASFSNKSEIQIAKEQATEILATVNSWSGDLFEVEAIEVVKNLDDVTRESLLFNPPSAQRTSAKFTLRIPSMTETGKWEKFTPVLSRVWLVDMEQVPKELLPDPASLEGAEVEGIPYLVKVSAPRTIGSFRQLWNAALNAQIVLPAGDPTDCYVGLTKKDFVANSYSFSFMPKFMPMKCEIEHPFHEAGEVEMSFWKPGGSERAAIENSNFTKWDFEFSTVSGLAAGTPTRIIVPIRDLKKIKFDAQRALIKRSDKWGIKTGLAFGDAFPELSSVGAAFEEMDILSAVRILDAESKRQGDVFEALGLKIPAEAAVRYGVLLILGVQLYLWIHLHEFGNRPEHEEGFDVAWIGVYFSRSARVVFLLSLFLLPACAMLLLSLRGLSSSTQHTWLPLTLCFISNAASLTLSLLIFRALPLRYNSK